MKTKTLLIVIIFLQVFWCINAQTYKPMLIKGNKWNVLHYGYDYNLTQVLEVSTDTIINDTVYSKIISAYDSLSSNWSLVGYMREDTLAQEVYYRSLDTNATNILYYSFNVKIGDSVIISIVNMNESHLPLDEYYYKYNQVDSIDSVKIGETYHKRIFVDYEEGLLVSSILGHHVWIEGIGGMEGPISSSLAPNTIDPTQLLCFFNNDSLEYKADSAKYNNCFYWEHLARTYHPFPTQNAMWTEMYYYPDEDGHAPVFHCYALKDNDTTINGNLYHKLYHSTDTIFTEDKLVGGLREENEKVYYYSIVPVSFSPEYKFTDIPKDSEVLLYDFSFKIGDTVCNYGPNNSLIRVTNGPPLILVKIDSLLIGSEYRRRFNFGESTNDIIMFTSWVEGVGQLRGLLFATGDLPDNGVWNDLVCFRQGNEVLYHCNEWCNSQYDTCYYIQTGINQTNTIESIKIIPNPVLVKGTIEVPVGKFDRMAIMNISGIVVREYNVAGQSPIEISREGLPSGLYFVKLIDAQGNTANLKVIFQ